MSQRVAMLIKGVNVGGHRMEMARLRSLLAERGYENPLTYLQSGNAVFGIGKSGPEKAGSEKAGPGKSGPEKAGPGKSGPDDPAMTALAGELSRALEEEFGFGCPVVLRSGTDLDRCIASDPLADVVGDPSRYLIAFLAAPPEADRLDRLLAGDYGENQVRWVGGHLYMWCPDGISQSPFFRMNLDRDLATTVTSRNWNTVRKLASMAATP